jgi:phosphoribosylaminoimidazole carboxylase
LNEVAPRPHNSGHQTIEASYTSQYEQHLRAILGLPLGDPSMKAPAAIMYNILGEDEVYIFVSFIYLSFCAMLDIDN